LLILTIDFSGCITIEFQEYQEEFLDFIKIFRLKFRIRITGILIEGISEISTDFSEIFFNPFNWDLPKRKRLNGLFWFFFDKVKYFLSKFSICDATKKVFFALSDASRCVFEKSCSRNFAK
jgi:hypothetical protein